MHVKPHIFVPGTPGLPHSAPIHLPRPSQRFTPPTAPQLSSFYFCSHPVREGASLRCHPSGGQVFTVRRDLSLPHPEKLWGADCLIHVISLNTPAWIVPCVRELSLLMCCKKIDSKVPLFLGPAFSRSGRWV